MCSTTQEHIGTGQRWLAYNEVAVDRVAHLLLGVGVGGGAPCCLPHHRGRARIVRDPATGQFRYYERDCPSAPRSGRSLAAVRAGIGYGKLKDLSRIESWVWFSRLFWEADETLVELAPVRLPPLPPWTPDPARKLAGAFEWLVRTRWVDPAWQGRPIAFSRTFAAALAGLTNPADPQHASVGRSLRALAKWDVIRAVGPTRGPGEYVPGDGAWMQ